MNKFRTIVVKINCFIMPIIFMSSCSTKKHDEALSTAQHWQPVFLEYNEKLPQKFNILFEKGFKTKKDIKPNTPEKYVFDKAVKYTEPSELLLVSVQGDYFVAFAAGVFYYNSHLEKNGLDHTDQEYENRTLEPVPGILFGGLFFMHGPLKKLKEL